MLIFHYRSYLFLGAKALAEYITQNQFIQKLDIRGNDIRLDGLKSLSQAMIKNQNIISLKVDPTSMDLVSNDSTILSSL